MKSLLLLPVLLAVWSAPLLAQTAPAGGFTFIAPGKQTATASGLRLDGLPGKPARIQSPQLDVSAQAIAFDFSNKTIDEVRATGNVNLKVNLTSKVAGAPVTRVEATCSNATLVPGTRRLTLRGNLRGFYQVGNGARNTLSGDSAVLTYQGQQLSADIAGGTRGVIITVPAESGGRADALGTVTIRAATAKIDGASGVATFSGNARAISVGVNGFDVAAPTFILTRAADGTLGTLRTSGKTSVKISLPPEPVSSTNASATNTSKIGRPTRVEVTADGAVIERATSTATFSGNVQGFYRLQGTTGTPLNYKFAGDEAIIRYDSSAPSASAGFNVEISNARTDAPSFDLDF